MFDLSSRRWMIGWLIGAALVGAAPIEARQPANRPVPLSQALQSFQTAAPQTPPQTPAPPPAGAEPLTLQAALTLARANSQQVRAALAAAQLAAEDRVQARANLLPSVSGLL